MLKIEIDGFHGEITCHGSVQTVLAEISMAVSGVYFSIKKYNPAVAEAFRRTFTRAITDPNSPIWTEECYPSHSILVGGVFKKPHE